MNINSAFPSDYLRAADLRGKQIRVTIDSCEMVTIGNDDKPCLRFVGKEKGIILNKTNSLTLAIALGDETDEWAGKEMVLYPDKVMYEGKMVPCIRVRVDPPANGSVPDDEPPF